MIRDQVMRSTMKATIVAIIEANEWVLKVMNGDSIVLAMAARDNTCCGDSHCEGMQENESISTMLPITAHCVGDGEDFFAGLEFGDKHVCITTAVSCSADQHNANDLMSIEDDGSGRFRMCNCNALGCYFDAGNQKWMQTYVPYLSGDVYESWRTTWLF